ncbi:UNVERIFIED_CONTAM: hypothetical protein PYX00_005727 [Menopon gallinae]
MSGGRTAMTQSHSVHGGALSFMSCTSGRESSPLDEADSHQNGEFKTETKKKRFHPLRNLRRMFRRKTRHSNLSNDSYNIGSPETTEINTTPLEQRSCSTSKLVEENGMQNLMKSNRLAPGLSLSHDSVFTPDRADSGLSSSDLENSSLSISNFVPPPTEFPLKSHSSCSESSLLSMDSSEAELSPTAVKSDLDLGITTYKLSHSAAKHKMAVKPKRNHGAPRSRRRTVNSRSPLPSTPEVNEEVTAVKGFSIESTDFFVEDVSTPSKPSSPIADAVNDSAAKPRAFDLDFGTAEPAKQKEECTDVREEDWGDKDEDVPRKEESFFGRLLSRRSEKKKKNNGEKSSEEPESASPPKSSTGSRSVNRRQRVEPIEIPSSPSAAKKSDCVRESGNRMKISYSMSPPKTVLPNPIVSRSSSPPKVIWPEHFSYYKNGKESGDAIAKSEARTSVHEDTFSKIRRDLSPNVSKTKESQKIIADEVESKFKMLHASPKDAAPKVISHEKDDDKFKVRKEVDKGLFKSEKVKLGKVNLKSSSSDSIEKPEESAGKEVLITHEEPHYANLRNILPALSNYEKVHHGYENVQVIELVKKEKVEEKKGKAPRRDAVDGTPEFMKVQLNRVEPRGEEESNPPRARSTLIERRKSELMLTNETSEEKDWKKAKALKKQTSFSENATQRTPESSPVEKTDSEEVGEVVMRKKPSATGKSGDDQPELMKVFARRSLKVRESEEIAEEMRRSRDSDKENENAESPKEERKKLIKPEPEEKKPEKPDNEPGKKNQEEVVIQVTPLKPEIVSRKSVFQKYGRAPEKLQKPGQENGSLPGKQQQQRKEQSILEENKSNKLKEVKAEVVAVSCVKEANAITEEDPEETGFKRIQQRKAEWERRVQQAAK